ncbi:MAG: hypothetical protein M3Y87_09980 [Myxococcota bacterium]|nr:hypothetical protein [Myxococcota bacterium]
MALVIHTADAEALLVQIQTAIDGGKVRTWGYDRDGDFTHTAEQWQNKAWLRPRLLNAERLVLNIIAPRGQQVTKAIYGVYHGRFAEMVLTHFDEHCESIRATANAELGDVL